MTEREQLLDELRPVAFAIAYRMLGSVSEAEDVVQEALLRVHQALESGRADRLAARVRRHRDHPAGDQRAALGARPARALRRRMAARADRHRRRATTRPGTPRRPTRCRWRCWSCSRASRPEQRAVLLLHDVFDYDYAEIAAIVGKSQDNVRQLATRARRHVEQRRPALPDQPRAARRAGAAGSSPPPRRATSPALEALLAHDVELTGDGGGKVPALARSLHGRSRVARAMVNWFGRAGRLPGISLRPVEVNGGPGALFLDAEQRLIGVSALEIADGEITASARSSTPTSSPTSAPP